MPLLGSCWPLRMVKSLAQFSTIIFFSYPLPEQRIHLRVAFDGFARQPELFGMPAQYAISSILRFRIYSPLTPQWRHVVAKRRILHGSLRLLLRKLTDLLTFSRHFSRRRALYSDFGESRRHFTYENSFQKSMQLPGSKILWSQLWRKNQEFLTRKRFLHLLPISSPGWYILIL